MLTQRYSGNSGLAALLRILVLVLPGALTGCQSDTDTSPSEKNESIEQQRPVVSISESDLKFSSTAKDWGIMFTDDPDHPQEYDDRLIVGAGCAVGDIDMDSDLDVILATVNCGSNDINNGRIAVFRQTSPGRFVEDSAAAGLGSASGATGISLGDCNNDGFPDIILSSASAVDLWLNDGDGHFIAGTIPAQIRNSGWAISATWIDYDRDGWLDLFITNYLERTDQRCTSLSGGHRDFCSPLLFNPTVDRLYRNLGPLAASGSKVDAGQETQRQNSDEQGSSRFVRFQDVTLECGIAEHQTAGMGAVAADFNDDGWCDLYVASDQRPNRLWINQQNGTFQEQAVVYGCDNDFLGRPQASMGIALGLIGTEEKEGILVSHLSGEFHAYYARTQGGFIDESRRTEIGRLTRPYTGFGVALVDFNADGNCEIMTVNGRVARADGVAEDTQNFWITYREPIQVLEANDGIFRVSNSLHETDRHVARGLAIGDFTVGIPAQSGARERT